MRAIIEKLQHKTDLTREESRAALTAIMSGQAAEADIRDFLLAMNDKGPTVEELTGAALVMREFCLKVPVRRKLVIDIVGTGGDGLRTFNISTATAFVVAGAGVAVAKHGNRSVSSICGSADVLEALGIRLDLTIPQLSACLDEVGLVFLFAQRHHPAMKHAAAVRKALGVKTMFNVLGPLTNPAGTAHHLLGVYSRPLLEQVPAVLRNLGSLRAVVVHGADGIDEITTADRTYVSELNQGDIRSYEILPEEFGVRRAPQDGLKGGDPVRNAGLLRRILEGERGPRRSVVQLNAAFALYAAGKAVSPEEGMVLAAEALDDGHALHVLERLKAFTAAQPREGEAAA